jgi:hypothetical protein
MLRTLQKRAQALLTQCSFVVACSQDVIVWNTILVLLQNTDKLCRLFGIRIRLLNCYHSRCQRLLYGAGGLFRDILPSTIAPANLLSVFSHFSLTRYSDLCLGYTVSSALAPSERFKIFFTVPISDFRSFSAFRTIPITLDSCSVGEYIAVST